MNNPMVIFSLDSIIECWFDYCFLKNYTFHKLTSEFCFFLFFFLRVECWRVLKFKPKHVRQFAANNQCNRPTIGLTSQKTRRLNWGQCMCGDWWISILGLCQFLCVCGLSILAVILITGNEKRNRKRQEKGRKYDWTQQTRIKNR